jgi:hypothetical protein
MMTDERLDEFCKWLTSQPARDPGGGDEEFWECADAAGFDDLDPEHDMMRAAMVLGEAAFVGGGALQRTLRLNQRGWSVIDGGRS